MNKFKIEQTFKGTYPPEAAVWCNANNAHIEKQEGQYIIVDNPLSRSPLLKNKLPNWKRKQG